MRKRNLVLLVMAFLVLSIIGLSGCAKKEDEQTYSGTTIRVLVWADAHTEAVKALIPEFEEETGIKVVFEDLPSSNLTEKIAMNLVGKTGTYDLVAIDEPFMPKFAEYFVPYTEWSEPKVLDKKIDLDELVEAAVQGATWKDTVYGLPVNGNIYMMIYRKDLFENPTHQQAFKEKYGYDLKQPETLEQLLDVSEYFYQPENGLYGWGPFTLTSEGVTVETMWVLRSFGTRILSDDLQPVLDKEKAVQAFEYYKQLLNTSPAGKLAFGHPERIQAMNVGNLTIMLQWPGIIPDHENEEESMVAGKVGYMQNPAGPGGRAAITGVWALAIPKDAENKAAAAEFAYWWASKEAGEKLVKKGMSPVRKDLLTDPDLQKEYPWYQAQLENFEIGVNRPRFPEYSEISDVVRTYFANALSGEMTSEQAVNEMDQKIKEILEQNGYLK